MTPYRLQWVTTSLFISAAFAWRQHRCSYRCVVPGICAHGPNGRYETKRRRQETPAHGTAPSSGRMDAVSITWWRHQMETFLALLAFCVGIHRSPVNSLTKASDAELWCFLLSAPERTIEQTMETPVIWDDKALIMTSLWWYDLLIYVTHWKSLTYWR